MTDLLTQTYKFKNGLKMRNRIVIESPNLIL
ncbi:hypothetical protein FHW04_003798 [Pantoea sp. AN62]